MVGTETDVYVNLNYLIITTVVLSFPTNVRSLKTLKTDREVKSHGQVLITITMAPSKPWQCGLAVILILTYTSAFHTGKNVKMSSVKKAN